MMAFSFAFAAAAGRRTSFRQTRGRQGSPQLQSQRRQRPRRQPLGFQGQYIVDAKGAPVYNGSIDDNPRCMRMSRSVHHEGKASVGVRSSNARLTPSAAEAVQTRRGSNSL